MVEAPKKKAMRPKKAEAMRYSTRGNEGCSYAVPDGDFSSESSDSDDPNYDGIVDSDYELLDEEDEVDFERNVDGDPSLVGEFEDMGFEGNISDVEDDGSDGFPSIHGSDSEGEDVGPYKVGCKKRFSDWVEFNPKTDMRNPRFQLGMVFPNSVVFENAVRKYTVLTRS